VRGAGGFRLAGNRRARRTSGLHLNLGRGGQVGVPVMADLGSVARVMGGERFSVVGSAGGRKLGRKLARLKLEPKPTAG